MPIQYPLDTTGVNPASLVTGELHSVNEAQMRDFYFLVPNFAPFYATGFKLCIIENGVYRELVEDVDFSFCLPYIAGTRTYGKQLYGGITLHNLSVDGILSTDYQTLGGDQVVDRLHVLTELAERAYNPRTTVWDLITNVPNALPPAPHPLSYDQTYGQEELVNALGQVRDAIAQNSSLTIAEIRQFLITIGATAAAGYVKKIGDTMLGPLELTAEPTEGNHAINRQYMEMNTVSPSTLVSLLSMYVNNADLSLLLDGKLNKLGDQMVGPLLLNSNPAEDMQAATKQYVDNAVQALQLLIQAAEEAVGNISGSSITREEVMALIGEVSAKVDRL